MEIKLIIKKTLNIKLIVTFIVFIYFSLINLTCANENFIVTIVNKIPISKIDVINKAKLLSYSIENNLNTNNLPKFYNQALENLINEKVILSEGLKINKNIENLVKKQSENLLLAEFKNSEIQSIILKNNILGIDRVVAFGRALEFEFNWDGYDVVRNLSRTINFKN